MNNYIVLLCGGNSIRFQENKLLYPLHGKPLYRHTFNKLKNIVQRHSNYSLIVVSQYKDLLEQIQEDCLGVYSKECEKGASYSIKVALDNIPKEACYITFMVADQPYMFEETIEDFLQKSMEAQCKIGAVDYEGELYNPVIFHSLYRDELYSLENDQGGKRVVRRHLDDVFHYLILNPYELKDIDRKDDF